MQILFILEVILQPFLFKLINVNEIDYFNTISSLILRKLFYKFLTAKNQKNKYLKKIDNKRSRSF